MASNYDFRILIDTTTGIKYSYGTSSFVSVQQNTSKVLTTSESVAIMNRMRSVPYFNGKTNETGSAFLFSHKGAAKFGNTLLSGNYQYISASIKQNPDSGSIVFHANTSTSPNEDYPKRYKFFGNKVCNVLGIPENYWIYAD